MITSEFLRDPLGQAAPDGQVDAIWELLRPGHYFGRALWVFDRNTSREVGERYPLNVIPDSGGHLPVPFAADLFGGLYLSRSDGTIIKVDTEDLQITLEASCLAEWAERVLEDPDDEVGEAFVREWESANGELEPGARLSAVIPFVLGGTYDFDNIRSRPLLDALEWRADLALKLRNLEPGSRILVDLKE